MSGGGGACNKDPVPIYLMNWEWGRVKCDFGTIHCCGILSVTEFLFFSIILNASPLPYVHRLILSHSWSFDYIQ